MLRLFKLLIFLGFLALFCGSVGLGFLFILSGGDPIGYARASYLRLSIASRQDELERPVSSDPTERYFAIEQGESLYDIALKLQSENLILDTQLFIDYMIVEKLDTQVQSGVFFLSQMMTIPEIARTIINQENAGIVFAVLPGSRIEEIAQNVDETPRFTFSGDDFLLQVSEGAQIDPIISTMLGIPPGASLEGFLLPGTYILSPNVTPVGLRDTLIEGFIEGVGSQLLQDTNKQGLSMRDAVSIASIVEREAVWDDEHTLIASVYRNRLNVNMRLEADPTVQYALNGSRGKWWPNITIADYRGVESPYNLYLNYGLPPGPIANPSLSAIRAAIYPAESSYLYFRARCDGSHYHQFSTTYDEHVANGC